MSLVINTNSIATQTRNYLATNQSNLQRSLGRLASGSRIVKPSDDAGGLAVGNKLTATLNRNTRTQQNVMNSISFLQVQDGALASVGKILDRMSELKTMSLDVTKNTTDIANYNSEFNQLQDQLANIRDEKFNGINLFKTSADPLTVYTTEGGKGSTTTAAVAQVDTVTITAGDLTAAGSATYSVTVDGTAHTVTEGAEIATGNTAAQIATALATKIGAQADASAADGTLTVTASTAGTAQTVATATTDSGAAAASAATTTANVAAVYSAPAVDLTRNNVYETGTNGKGLVSSNSYELSDSSQAASAGGDLASYSVDDFVQYIQNAATARATNGAQMSRLEQSHALLTTNHANIEGARSRLMDVDIATESTHFAKHNILVQSSAAMLAQANSITNVALQLLG